MSTTDRMGTVPVLDLPTQERHGYRGRQVVGGFFLTMGGVHLGLVAADPTVYADFADHALFPFVRNGWSDIFMQHPSFWGLCLMAGEIVLGILLLAGPRTAPIGWAGVIGFHVLLLLFGFGVWAWCVPALAILTVLARNDVARPDHVRTQR
jgi:hypothetical protein